MNTNTEESRDIAFAHERQSTEIASIWKSILGVDEITNNDQFFDLGGNSMLLIVMIEKIHEKYDKEIDLEDLADGITVDTIANLLVSH